MYLSLALIAVSASPWANAWLLDVTARGITRRGRHTRAAVTRSSSVDMRPRHALLVHR